MLIRVLTVMALAGLGLAGLHVPAAAQNAPEPAPPPAVEPARPDAGDVTAPVQEGSPAQPQPPATASPAPQSPTSPAPPGTTAAQTPGKEPARLPPPDSAPLVRYVQIAFPTQGDRYIIEPQTYLYYIQTRGSRPSEGVWVPYNEDVVLADFKRLWATNFLDNLWIEVKDVPFENGVVGKHVIYNLEERQRVKIVDYVGLKKVDQSKIEEVMKEQSIQIRLDTFIDPEVIRKVKGIVKALYAEKGYQFTEISHETKELPGGPKLVHLTFNITEGPQVKIRRVEFDGNKALSDGKLRGQMKENKAPGMFSFILGGGTYQEAKFEEDADRLIEYYRNRGYVFVRVGQPELKYLSDSSDKKTRFVELRVPVDEGERYRVGDFVFDGNKTIKSEGLRPLFKIKTGDWYSDKKIRKGMITAREIYGTIGYWEFTGFPDVKPRGMPDPDAPEGSTNGSPKGSTDGNPSPPKSDKPVRAPDGAPYVDVTMRLQEGEQYFVNRITFVGNTTTRDNVIRRELRLVEKGVFNTEALKHSVRRINQLGYFKTLEEEDQAETVKIEKTPGEKNQVDVTLNFEEQNRNQLTFGAGVSQFEGFFGQLAFQTSNFLGRGESATFSVLAGRRAKNYQLAFTEPFMFDRPISAGVDLYHRELQYIFAYTQASKGGNVSVGFPVADFTRTFITYSLAEVSVKDINPLYLNEELLRRNLFLRDALLQGEGGRRIISQVTPSLVHNTIDNPIFPTQGKRFSLITDFAGIGGNVNFIKPRVEGVWMFRHTSRTSFGVRAQVEFIQPWGSTVGELRPGDENKRVLPIFERLFLGGEYSVRGYDIRSIGPRDVGTPEAPGTFIVIGGNKSLLFNAEYLITIAGPVRLVLFYDAGQVRDFGENYAMNQFKTSTGAEIRFFMPVLNVPFRLIFAHNPQREGVFENNLEPAKKFTFKFAVGSTF